MSRVFFVFDGLTVILLPILVVPGLILVITVFLSLGFVYNKIPVLGYRTILMLHVSVRVISTS